MLNKTSQLGLAECVLFAAILSLSPTFPLSEAAQQETHQNPGKTIGIVRHPPAADYRRLAGHGNLSSLPVYDPSSKKPWQVDLRSSDLSTLDLRERLVDLLHADFDSKTSWPPYLPEAFKPEEIMEMGKNPGLGVRKVHAQGITGKGVNVAIIDQCLLVDHVEYKDRLRFYEEIHCLANEHSSMHGPAVASLAVGKTVGVAPESGLFYIAETHGNIVRGDYEWDFTYLARSIDRILEINDILPEKEKIRVLAIAVGWSPEQKGYREVVESVKRAKQQGLFVVSSSLYETYDRKIYFHGLDRNPVKDPDRSDSYGPGSWWADAFYSGKKYSPISEVLLVPMDSRCTASPTGETDYSYYAMGGWSWCIPYIAGLYALACQVKPDIVPEIFWEEALKTGVTAKVMKDNKSYSLGIVVNPPELMKNLRAIGQRTQLDK